VNFAAMHDAGLSAFRNVHSVVLTAAACGHDMVSLRGFY
jgi:hypothetical protein